MDLFNLLRDKPVALVLGSGQQEALKWLAVASMTVDHTVKVLFGAWPPGVAVGRLAFPLFAFLLAYNLTVRQVAPGRYLPLLAVGLCAQPFHAALFPGSLNIMFTLLLGVGFFPLYGWLNKQLEQSFLAAVALATVTLVLSSFVNYGFAGVLLVPAFQLVLKRPTPLSALLLAVLLLQINHFTPYALVSLFAPTLIYLVAQVRVSRLPRNRWVFIVYYPLHLAALCLLSRA